MKRFFSLFIPLALASVPLVAFAVNSVTIDQNTNLVLPSDGSAYTMWAGGKFDSLTVNNDNFSFTFGENGKLEITSADRKKLTNTINSMVSCDTDRSYVKLEPSPGSGTTTVTLTPSGTCSGTGGGGTASSGSSSSGGSSSSSSSPPPPPPPPVVATPTPAPSSFVAVAPTIPVISSTSGVSAPAILTQTLTLGSRGDEVKKLQEYLSQDPALYPQGTVSSYFGPLTQAAVGRLQERYNIATKGSAGYGMVGPKTRAKLNELMGGGSKESTNASLNETQRLLDQIQSIQKQINQLQNQ